MSTIVEPFPHDAAVLDALKTIGRPVGFATAPNGALEAVRATPPGPGYFILYPIGGGSRSGPVGDPYADAELVYQITTVARLPDEVRWLVGKIEPALAAVTVAGRVIYRVQPDDLEGVYPDRDLTPPVFYGTPRYRLYSTPA